MYITAHWVQTPEGDLGINGWYHQHPRNLAWPADLDGILGLIETNPGREIESQLAFKPGGNSVLAYIDVLAPERARPEAIQEALACLEAADPDQSPITAKVGSIVVRMGCVIGRRDRWKEDVATLGKTVMELLDFTDR